MKTGTKQWAPHSENCIEGCSNNCRYCYAKKMAIRFKRKTAENWKDETKNLNRSHTHVRKYDGLVMFPTTHDLHMKNVDIWSPYLGRLLHAGNNLLIVSKPEYKAICHITENFGKYRDKIMFRFTIGSCNESVLKFWEPNAPSFSERVMALWHARDHMFRTSVSMEPLLDIDPDLLIELVHPFVTEDIWIGTMNHMSKSDFSSDEEKMYNRMLEINSLQNITGIYNRFKNNPRIKWKDSVQKMLGLVQEE